VRKPIRPPVVAVLGAALVLGAARAASGQVGGTAAKLAEPAGTAAGAVDTAAIGYVIGPADVLSVVFWRDEQLSSQVLVRPDGKISIPLLDDVQAAGLTPEELRDRLTTEARRYVTDPKVTVVVQEINSRHVYITGLVATPGAYPMTHSMTVLQLIATAGGLQDFAKSKEIRIVRVNQAGRTSLRFNYEETARGQAEDVELQPGDTVIVP
jgi:polysaccharide export outer membrane protein